MAMRLSCTRFVLPLALAMAAGGTAPAMAQVQWRSPNAPAFAPEKDIQPLLANLAAQSGTAHLAVQLHRPVTDADRAVLSVAGLQLGSPLGGNAFFVSVECAKLDPAAAAIIKLIAGVQAIDPAWKLHAAFAEGDGAAWTVVGDAARSDGEREPVVALYVVLHAGVKNDVSAAAMIAKYGGIVRDTIDTINGLVVEVPLSAAALLAREDSVQWIEPALPLLAPTNSENRTLTHANQAQAAPYNLDGTGVTAFVFDGGGVRASHTDFGGRVTVIDGSGQANHATHVAGTIGGNGASSGGANRGMAPNVTILSAALSASGEFLYTNPGDIETDYAAAFALGADVANNSIGTNVNANGFPCSWHGDYGVTDSVIDSIVRGSQTVTGGQAFRVVWAAGNERGGRCDTAGGYRTIGPPGGAKNHISVAAVNANDDSMTGFSGWGPTDDGRLKPDVAAPGCQSNGDVGVTSCSSSSDTAYSVSCGTSMASPTATGVSSLLLQEWGNLYPGEPLPRNSMLKVLLAQSAMDRGSFGPDYSFGHGSIRADAAVDLLRTGALDERALNDGFSEVYSITVAPGSGPLVLTVAWDDAPGTPNVVPSLVNDLDLRVFAPDGQRHYPWTLDPATPNAAAVRTQEDHRNNVEQVRVDAPAAGTWTVEVRGTAVPVGPQPYSIVASNPTFAHTGSVSLRLEPVAIAPASIDPRTPLSLVVDVSIEGDTLAPGSVQLHHRTSLGAFTTVAMTDIGGGQFQATLPGVECDDAPEYFFSAQGVQLGTVMLPDAGPAGAYSSLVGDLQTSVFDMETAAGWTVGAAGDNATTGLWERAVPQGTSAQPGEDHTATPGVNCWVTGATAGGGVGSFDIDGGTTTLLSPIIDLSAATTATRIGYWRWYSNVAGAAPNADVFRVEITSNGGANWVNVETVGPAGEGTSGGWIYHEFKVSDFVSLTSTVRMRFIAADLDAGSIVEAAIDDVSIFAVACSDACAADFDGDTFVTVPDIFAFLVAWFAQNPSADFDGNTSITVPDIFAFLSAWFAGC